MGFKVAPPLESTASQLGENGRPCERASLAEASRRSTSAVAGEPWGTKNEENNAKADAQLIFYYSCGLEEVHTHTHAASHALGNKTATADARATQRKQSG